MAEEKTVEKVARCIEAFRNVIDAKANVSDLVAARAPGRVNLIGEHTDYNDGFVFPMAIDREIVMVGRARNDGVVRLYSLDYGGGSTFEIERIEHDPAARWSDYIRGVVDVVQKAGYRVGGIEAVVTGDVPRGSGLSSSAALEVATITFLDALFSLGIEPAEKALLGQRAENEFVGVACGIMDQFISAAGKEGHGLFLDCRSLEYENVPLHLADARVLVVNTNKHRGLVDSEYNARRKECEEGAAFFAERIPGVKALRDVTPEQFEVYQEELPEPVRSRCRHVIGECQRVLESVNALKAGDLALFGKLMNESHVSLRDDYQVSCRELDLITEIAWNSEGVYGARMTGGGFGGCAVVLVHKDQVEAVSEAIRDRYPRETSLTPELFVFTPVDGAGVYPIESE